MSTGLINNCCTPQKLSVNNSTGYLSISDGNAVYLGTLIKTLGIKTPVVNFVLNGYIATLTYIDANGVIQNQNIDLSALAQGGSFIVTNTPSVNLLYNSANLSAVVNLSAASGNALSINGDGLFAPAFIQTPLTANDSSTVDFTTSGINNMTLTGSVKVSANASNRIQVAGDGLLVPDMTTYFLPGQNITLTGSGSASSPYIVSAGGFSQIPLSVNDSSTLHFISSGSSGMNLTGNVRISSTTANALISNADGLYVPQSSTNSYTDAQARAAISANAPIVYNNITGVISAQLANTSTNGFLTSSDWNMFNSKITNAISLGSVSSLPIYQGQSGTQLQFNGVRAGANVTINQVGNDIVINSTGGTSTAAQVFSIDFLGGDGGSLTPTVGSTTFNPTNNPLIGKTVLGFWIEGVKTSPNIRANGYVYYTFTSSNGNLVLSNATFEQDTYYSILYR